MKKILILCLLIFFKSIYLKSNTDDAAVKASYEEVFLDNYEIRDFISRSLKAPILKNQDIVTDTDIDAFLANTMTVPIEHEGPLPASIDFLCCDLKFEKKKRASASIKICEFGNGIYAGRSATKVYVNDQVKKLFSPYWNLLWHYLKQFNLPVWFVGPYTQHKKKYYQDFITIGGLHSLSLEELQQDERFLQQAKKTLTSYDKISDHAGIIVYNGPFKYRREKKSKALTDFLAFKKKYPQFLLVSDTANTHVIKKHRTYKLFDKPHLKHYLPRYKLYKTKYTASLAQQIKNDLSCSMYVIKPLGSSLSSGVIIIKEKQLDSTLRLILQNTHNIPKNAHRSLRLWKKYKQDKFIVAEYAPSKTITVGSKNYDPTMRIVFMLRHNAGEITTTILAGFWKIPLEPLSREKNNLTQQHVTIPNIDSFFVGIPVSKEDFNQASTIMKTFLPPVYESMLIRKKS